MSKIVVLSGSPRKNGNTELLVKAFVEGAEINNEVEVIPIHKYHVNPCIGCTMSILLRAAECFRRRT